MKYLFSSAIILVLYLSSCEVVKPYQRVYLNSEEMDSGKQAVEIFENEAQAYREASEGGGTGKGGGGCGCN